MAVPPAGDTRKMGGFDPSSVLNFLKASQGDSSGFQQDQSAPQQPSPQPPATQQPQMPQAQPQTSPQQQGIKGYLSNIFYNMGEAAKAHLGMPTDAQIQIQQQKFAEQKREFDQETNLKWQQIQNQFKMVTLPNGVTMPFALAQKAYPALINKEARLGAADIAASAKTEAAKIMTGQVKQLVPAVDPDTGKPGYMKIDKQGNSMGFVDGSIVPSLMSRTSSTIEWKEDENGNFVPLPKSSTRSVNIPGGSPAQPGAGAGVKITPGVGITVNGQPIHGKNATQMVVGTDSEGKQVAGTPNELRAAGVNQFTKLDATESGKVNTARQLTSPNGLFSLIDKDLAQFKPGELEGLSPRWNEFLAGTVGTADSRYMALRTHLNGLLSTALMQAHVGARGGERIMEHFEDLANAGKMSLPTLRAALNAEKQYVEEKAMRPTPKAPAQNLKNPFR